MTLTYFNNLYEQTKKENNNLILSLLKELKQKAIAQQEIKNSKEAFRENLGVLINIEVLNTLKELKEKEKLFSKITVQNKNMVEITKKIDFLEKIKETTLLTTETLKEKIANFALDRRSLTEFLIWAEEQEWRSFVTLETLKNFYYFTQGDLDKIQEQE
jgi:hypothetical protein